MGRPRFTEGAGFSAQDARRSMLRQERADEELPLGWERRESDIRPGHFYYTNPTTRQVALTIEGARRDFQRKLEGDRDDGRKRKSAWDQREDEKDDARRKSEDKISKLLKHTKRSAWDQR